MKSTEFNVGDFVRVKRQKQVMYIPKLTIDKKGAYCTWKDARNRQRKDIFPFSQLERITSDVNEVV